MPPKDRKRPYLPLNEREFQWTQKQVGRLTVVEYDFVDDARMAGIKEFNIEGFCRIYRGNGDAATRRCYSWRQNGFFETEDRPRFSLYTHNDFETIMWVSPLALQYYDEANQHMLYLADEYPEQLCM